MPWQRLHPMARAIVPDQHRRAGPPVRSRDVGAPSIPITELVHLILAVVKSDSDIPRSEDWARLAYVSPATIISRCARCGLRTKAVLDLARIIRATSPRGRSGSFGGSFDSLDARTVGSLLRRAGLDRRFAEAAPPIQVLRHQTLVRHPLLLRELESRLLEPLDCARPPTETRW
jgi:hypothetical protein